MKRLFVYPYSQKMEAFLKSCRGQNGFEIGAVGCFPEDFAYVKRRFPEKKVCSDWKEGVKACDAVLLNPELEEEKMKARASQCREYAASEGIPVLGHQESFEPLKEVKGYPLRELDAPVVAVMGQGENCSKLETTARAAEIIQSEGYRVLAVSGNLYSPYCGMEKLPEYFLSEEVGFSRKVLNFNHYLVELERKCQPDVILLDVPGGVIPAGDVEYFYHGEMALVASHAVQLESILMNIYHSSKVTDGAELGKFLSRIQTYCREKFDAPVFQFCVSSQSLRVDREGRRVDYLFLSEAFINSRRISAPADNVCMSGDGAALKRGIKSLLAGLEENVEIV